ncbi:hypothetical protein PHYPO_G00200410 [Pangasianodon hypophthalmus]|uniref:Tektin n=1 Tax=Pangasianodon hypophthalmus TaxID=310915 RepID=A0A5N5PD84_PANHP|nr:hypothetical protein PHYPO_G00200410 [Pangasianodon hypophthalmus]
MPRDESMPTEPDPTAPRYMDKPWLAGYGLHKMTPPSLPTIPTRGEDTFKLHSVDLELEAVEKQICDLQVKQAQLRQWKAALESSRTDAHLSQSWRSSPLGQHFQDTTHHLTGEDTFELHSVDLDLEAVEKQIRDLQVKQAQLRQRKAALESSRIDAHLSQINSRRETNTPTTSTPRTSLPRPSAPRMRPAQVSFTPVPGYHGAWMQQQRKTRARTRARTSPPPPPPV